MAGSVRRTKDRTKDKAIFQLRKSGRSIRDIAMDLEISVDKVQSVANEFTEKGNLSVGR